MGFSKNDFDKVDLRIKKITEQTVEQIEIDSELPPTIEQLEDNNKTYSIMAAILFIDIRKSTHLTENSQAKSMVKIYRSFMRMAVDCVRKNGGVTRQFLGDRIMGVFIDSADENGNIVDSAADKAINAARSLQTVIDYSLNKYLKTNVNGKVIECGIGIDYGKVLVTPPFFLTQSTAILINERYILTILFAWLFSVKYVDLRISINSMAAMME